MVVDDSENHYPKKGLRQVYVLTFQVSERTNISPYDF